MVCLMRRVVIQFFIVFSIYMPLSFFTSCDFNQSEDVIEEFELIEPPIDEEDEKKQTPNNR